MDRKLGFPDSPTKAPDAPLQSHRGEKGMSVRVSGSGRESLEPMEG